jgi:hypothetical protein
VRSWSDSRAEPNDRAPSPTKRVEAQPISGSSNSAIVLATSSGVTRTFESETRRISPEASRAAATPEARDEENLDGRQDGPGTRVQRAGEDVFHRPVG